MTRLASKISASGWMGDVCVIATLVAAAVLAQTDFEFYYWLQEEDGWVEWGTFWAFLMAAGFYSRACLGQHRSGTKVPWFLGGIALFCFLVAMEEISWGQRLLGFRAPVYFLESNYQQEVNVHNLATRWLRYRVVEAASLGYGVLLPAAFLLARVRVGLQRIGIEPPSFGLAPAFGATFALHMLQPWRATGEWVELTLGFCFLFAGADQALREAGQLKFRAPVAAVLGLVMLTGACTLMSKEGPGSNPATVAEAEREIEALRRDFMTANLPTKCGLAKRLYNYAKATGARSLRTGRFASLTRQGLPEERAQFLIDPWHSAYWILDQCTPDKASRRILLFSNGPNRRYDSTGWELGGDDIGAFLLEVGPVPDGS